MKKILKVLLFLLLAAALFFTITFAVLAVITKDAVLDESKLTKYSQSISVCDSNGNEITNASVISKRKSVRLDDLDDNTINAFIASEDRTFFKHNGLNYKRMVKALYKNVVSRSFKEGASTISQQLIKNTHLTGDKTIKRKLSEIKLTRQLEKKYSKRQILEMYLNTIYFGHNCYGLESASEFYFGKTASALTLEQSAAMAGLLTSPNNYSPFKNPEKYIARRNTVLDCMYECGFIDDSERQIAQDSPLSAQRQQDGYGDYLNAVFEELEELDIDFYRLSDGYTIKTNLDANLQKFIENLDFNCDNTVIITSVQGGVKAYKSTVNGAKRQPGSTIKPLLVYAPAIEEKLIHPSTKILDEKINYGGYSPENYDKNYHGYVTVAESIAKSYNIPAVKTLNSLTIDKTERYAEKIGIRLENDEKNLSLALGGMKYGVTLKNLCDSYRMFANGGDYTQSHFIKEITLTDGTTVYKAQTDREKVFSQGTCSLMNDMLINTTQSGTAKKMKDLSYNVASKTGTCGNAAGNTDAYCISYTSEDCVGVWLGDKNNAPLNVTGGNDCAVIVKNVLNKLYEKSAPPPLDVSTGTTEISIDKDEYNKNNKIILADSAAPKLSAKKIKVLTGNEPKLISTKYSNPVIEKPDIFAENNTVLIRLCQTEYYDYVIKRRLDGENVVIYDGKWVNEIYDTPENGKCVYTVTPYYCDGNKIYYGKTVELPAVNICGKEPSPQYEIPDIVNRDWYNE